MKNLKKKLEERHASIHEGREGILEHRVKYKDLLFAVLPLLGELQEEYWKLMSQPLHKRKGLGSFRDFLEKLLEE